MRKKFIVDCRGRKLILGSKTCIMGILNVTPDSFSDGGMFYDKDKAIAYGIKMASEGANIIDVGGESTRPGAFGIPPKEQIKRVIPVIRALAEKTKAFISIDTSSSIVAEAAINAGAVIVNDISGLRIDKNLAAVIARYNAGCVIMHIKGSPRTMQKFPRYKNLMKEIRAWLKAGIDIAIDAGISRDRIIVDPGIGFGKTVKHNLEIIKNLSCLNNLKRPVLIGPSRKSFIGKILNLPVEGRLMGTAASVSIGIACGAHIVRVHDVKEMLEVARVTDAILTGDRKCWKIC